MSTRFDYIRNTDLAVFAVRAGDKKPATPNGLHDATADHEHWLSRVEKRGENLGAPTGHVNGFFTVDADDLASWTELVTANGGVPETRTVRTPRGGKHFEFNMPEGVDLRGSVSKIAANVDIRANGNYVLLPGSETEHGVYEVELDIPRVNPPQWLIDAIVATSVTAERPRGESRAGYDPWLASIPENADYVREQVQLAERTIAKSYEGNYHGPCLSAAVIMGSLDEAGVLPDGMAEELLDEWRENYGIPNRNNRDKTVQDGLAYGREKPAQLPSDVMFWDYKATGTNLPPQFFEARPELRALRDHAHAEASSADVAFYSSLAEIAGSVHKDLKMVTGIKGEAALNLIVCPVGESGDGKSSNDNALDEIPESNRFTGPIGSGEGLIEAYFEWVEETVPGAGSKTKTVKKKKKVRSNAFFFQDEGEQLFATGDRKGASIFPTLRSMWSGAKTGAKNATVETTRSLDKGSYAFGAVIGLQPVIVRRLLTETHEGAGTTQRFLFCKTTDPSIPDVPPEKPEVPQPFLGWDHAGWMPMPVVTFPESITEDLRRIQVMRNRGEREYKRFYAHHMLTRCKVAAILALWNHRTEVDIEDWLLAGVAVDTSANVRDEQVAIAGKAAEEREKAAGALRDKRAAHEEEAQRLRVQKRIDDFRERGVSDREIVRRLNSRDRECARDLLGLS
ncbi:bifunctional DNA primase/polymerase [Streptomonospora sp. PA3]|uniref:bifunctional DNA primase/polymerase n=1 Tax=Streptomonospora sp. PA3 TaxID=2607326 RepID=UPI0016429EC4|nr:bifunctional DNA primase/polymerase [Streptomonospora sp. PA3]